MEIYRSAPQKSSDLGRFSFNTHYGLCRSVAALGVGRKLAAHLRIYEAALRLGMGEMLMTAQELVAWLGEHDVKISKATAQRALTDTRFFRYESQRKNGKRGRPFNLYYMVDPRQIGALVGIDPMGADWGAPQLAAVDVSSARNYKLALVGRAMVWMDTSSRKQQMEYFGWSKPTVIHWTREVCEITPQYKRISSDDLFQFRAFINGDDLFLHEVREREHPRDHRYWLEVVNDDGEICKLPCTVDAAERWLPKSEVVICEQLTNRYTVHAAYRDAPIWEVDGSLLPY